MLISVRLRHNPPAGGACHLTWLDVMSACGETPLPRSAGASPRRWRPDGTSSRGGCVWPLPPALAWPMPLRPWRRSGQRSSRTRCTPVHDGRRGGAGVPLLFGRLPRSAATSMPPVSPSGASVATSPKIEATPDPLRRFQKTLDHQGQNAFLNQCRRLVPREPRPDPLRLLGPVSGFVGHQHEVDHALA
jgi:hypothetical protein